MELTSVPTNWLDCNTVQYVDSGGCETVTLELTTNSDGITWIPNNTFYPWTDPSCHYYHSYPWWSSVQKIRLTMSDVEKLRAAAKKDKTLKKVLQKIGPHIEVEVDF